MTKIDPNAGKPADQAILVNVPRLVTAYYAEARAKAVGLTLEIDYVEARKDAGMAKIAKFLKISPAGFGAPRTAKRNSDNIVSRFKNRDDVLAYLDEHGLEHWAKES